MAGLPWEWRDKQDDEDYQVARSKGTLTCKRYVLVDGDKEPWQQWETHDIEIATLLADGPPPQLVASGFGNVLATVLADLRAANFEPPKPEPEPEPSPKPSPSSQPATTTPIVDTTDWLAPQERAELPKPSPSSEQATTTHRSIVKTTTDRLAPQERVELLDVIACRHTSAHTTFGSDMEGTSIGYITLIMAGLLMIGVGYMWKREMIALWTFDGRRDLWVPIAVHLVVPLGVWAGWRLYKLRNRCGWAVTTFGLVKVRGHHLKVVPFAEITRAELSPKRSRSPYDYIRISTRDGRAFSFMVNQVFDVLVANLPPAIVERRAA